MRLLAAPAALAQSVGETPGRPWADRVQTQTLDLILPDSLGGEVFAINPFAQPVRAYSETGYALIMWGSGTSFQWVDSVEPLTTRPVDRLSRDPQGPPDLGRDLPPDR